MTAILLFPGELACRLLGLEGEDNRLILRMWANTLAWGLIGAIVAAVAVA